MGRHLDARELDQDEPQPDPPPGNEFFVTCHPGLEEVVASELISLGIRHVQPGKAGVMFWSERVSDGYRCDSGNAKISWYNILHG